MRGCYIVGSGSCGKIYIPKEGNSYIIAADGGYLRLKEAGIAPSLVVGDFDSSKAPEAFYNVLTYPKEKDETDTMLAVKKGIEEGCEVFFIYGGTGGREDHTFANLQLLSYLADNGLRGFLLYGDMAASVIKNGSISFDRTEAGYISVFAFGDTAANVTVSGLKYSLKDAVLSKSFPLGVSNEFTGKPAEIKVEDGSVLVMWQTEPERVVISNI